MHIRGRVQHQPSSTAQDRCNVEIECTAAATVIDTADQRIIYEGVIFDATDGEIANAPDLLDSAFGHYTYAILEKHTGNVVIGADRMGFSAPSGGRDSRRR